MNKKTLVTIISIIIIAGVLYKGKTLLKERQDAIVNEPTPITKVDNIKLIHAKDKVLQNKESYLGELLATKEINLATKIPGYIKQVYVQESTSVKKGDLLVKIDDRDTISNIKALQKTQVMQKEDLLLAKSTYERNKKLYEIGGISKEKLDLSAVVFKTKEAQLENTKQKIIQLNNQKEYLVIRAPFDGIVERVFMHKGDLAPLAKPILSLSNKEQKILFSYAKESTDLKQNDPVIYKNNTIATVSTLYNSATNGLSMAEAKLPKPLDIPLHSNINIEVVTDQKRGCVVPSSTLIHEKDALYILEYKDKSFSKKPVEVLLEENEELLITPCTQAAIASAPEVKLKELLAYEKVAIKGSADE